MTKNLVISTAVFAAMTAAPALAQDISVKLGVLNDRSGVYADLSGEGSVVAARMAVEDFKAAENGMTVEIISADHQNKPDIGSNITRQWYDVDGVNAILDVPTSSVALAVADITAENNGVFLISGAGSTALTREQCRPTSVHWTYDTASLANGTGAALTNAAVSYTHLTLPTIYSV